MKLRMKGNSIRLRVTRSELTRLQNGERLAETVSFGAGSALVYALESRATSAPVAASFDAGQIVVTISPEQLTSWSEETQVGVYASLPVGAGPALEVSLEKDFACLDRSDEDNTDTFVNPLAGSLC